MTAQNDDSNKPRQDWNRLAKQALDLWQHHLTSLSQDEKAKADMAEMMRPMTSMATQWADMMQDYMKPAQAAAKQEETPASEDIKEEKTESKVFESEPEAVMPESEVQNITMPDSVKLEGEIAQTVESHNQAETEKVSKEVDKILEETVSEVPAMTPVFNVDIAQVEAKEIKQNDIQSYESAELSEPKQSASMVSSEQSQPAQSAEHDEPTHVVRSEDQSADTSTASQSSSRSALASSGSRDLADIADRLAQLEQELDTLRPRSKRSVEDNGKSAAGS